MRQAERLTRKFEELADSIPADIREEWLRHDMTRLLLIWTDASIETIKEGMAEGIFIESGYPEAAARCGALLDTQEYIRRGMTEDD